MSFILPASYLSVGKPLFLDPLMLLILDEVAWPQFNGATDYKTTTGIGSGSRGPKPTEKLPCFIRGPLGDMLLGVYVYNETISSCYFVTDVNGCRPFPWLTREIFIQGQRGTITLAEQRGLERDWQEGMEKGKREERLRIARALLKLTSDDTVIADKVGLPLATVQRLRKET